MTPFRRPSVGPDPLRHRGPSLLAVALTYVALFLLSLAVSMAMAGGQHVPSPFAPEDDAARYFASEGRALRALAFLQFGAAIPLGIFTATAASRIQFLGRKVAGIHITLFGGLAASGALALSAEIAWVLSCIGASLGAGAPHLAWALGLLCFATGGPGYVVPFGLLVAGVSVTAGLQGFLPRWVMAFGLGVAVVAELATLVLVLPAAGYLLPVARFLGFAWMIVVGWRLPVRKAPA